ncbi:MAG: LysM domain-containing protein [Ilumatobacteraceae bacterium]
MAATVAPYTVVVPARVARRQAAAPARPSTQVYVRRRLLVSLVFVAVVVALVAGAGNVLANRGGAPASAAAVRPASTYVVQPGDTLWSIAEANHGSTSQSTYVDALVAVNGGATLQVGQVITLP